MWTGQTLQSLHVEVQIACVPSVSSTWGMRGGLQREQTLGPMQVAVQWRHSPPSGPHGSTPQRTPSSSRQSPQGSSPPHALLHLLFNQSIRGVVHGLIEPADILHQKYIVICSPHLSGVWQPPCMVLSHSLSVLLCTSWLVLWQPPQRVCLCTPGHSFPLPVWFLFWNGSQAVPICQPWRAATESVLGRTEIGDTLKPYIIVCMVWYARSTVECIFNAIYVMLLGNPKWSANAQCKHCTCI